MRFAPTNRPWILSCKGSREWGYEIRPTKSPWILSCKVSQDKGYKICHTNRPGNLSCKGSRVWISCKDGICLTMKFRTSPLMVDKTWLNFVNYQFKLFFLLTLRFGLSSGWLRTVGLQVHASSSHTFFHITSCWRSRNWVLNRGTFCISSVWSMNSSSLYMM